MINVVNIDCLHRQLSTGVIVMTYKHLSVRVWVYVVCVQCVRVCMRGNVHNGLIGSASLAKYNIYK